MGVSSNDFMYGTIKINVKIQLFLEMANSNHLQELKAFIQKGCTYSPPLIFMLKYYCNSIIYLELMYIRPHAHAH